MARIDWKSIEEDFLSTGAAYAELARRHGVSLRSVQRHAAEGGWQRKLAGILAGEDAELLAQAQAETILPVELAALRRRERREKLLAAGDRLLEKLSLAVERADPDNVPALAGLVRALKDLRELQGLHKDSLDLAEQQERIRRLQLTRERDGESPAGVLILPGTAEPEEP